MNGRSLETIYKNVFAPTDGADPAAAIKKFQTLAAASLRSEQGLRDFKTYLKELNGGVSPDLTDEQIRAFFYLMAADQNALTVKPWDDGGVQLW